jgi:hypothetical protein
MTTTTNEMLTLIQQTLQDVMAQQATLMRMYDTVDQKFGKIETQLDKFKKEWRVKKTLQGVHITQDLLSCGQNDMIFAINKLTEEFNSERRQTEARITALQQEVQILTQLFIHGDEIKTYDLSTTFPEAYNRIVELEKQRAKTKHFRLNDVLSQFKGALSSSESDVEMSPSPPPLTNLMNKEM